MARSTLAAAAALSLVLLLAGTAAVSACVGTPVITSGNFVTAQPINATTALSLDGMKQVLEHFAPIVDYRSNTKSSFHCVDSRGGVEQLGAFGGDFAELVGGIAVYLKMPGVFNPADYKVAQNVANGQSNANKTANDFAIANLVASIFNAFMRDVATEARPFYYHTSAEKMDSVFKSVKEANVGASPVIFPARMPADVKVKSVWLSALAKGKNQGCGHVRLMIDEYKEYGLDSEVVPKTLVKAFFNYFWQTEPGSPQRAKVNFVMKEGSLGGKAIAVVTSTGACKGESPALAPARDGAQVFVYHPEAVTQFRKDILVPFFAAYAKKDGTKLDQAKFTTELEALQGKMAGATLKLLSPANALPLWNVEVKTTAGNAPARPPQTRNARG